MRGFGPDGIVGAAGGLRAIYTIIFFGPAGALSERPWRGALGHGPVN